MWVHHIQKFTIKITSLSHYELWVFFLWNLLRLNFFARASKFVGILGHPVFLLFEMKFVEILVQCFGVVGFLDCLWLLLWEGYFFGSFFKEGFENVKFDWSQVGLKVLENIDDFELFQHGNVETAMNVFLGGRRVTLNSTKKRKRWFRLAIFLLSR